jgi:hypothetical protein
VWQGGPQQGHRGFRWLCFFIPPDLCGILA